MRCFLALELNETVKAALARLQQDLRALDVTATYSRPEQMHVTLCFFGELNEEEAKQKIEVLKTFSFPSFTASLQGVGFFPSQSFARVVWLGFSEGRREVIELQKQVASLLHYSEERFESHITLARIKTPKNKERLAEFAKTSQEIASFQAKTLTFYQSILSPKGPTYNALFQKQLG